MASPDWERILGARFFNGAAPDAVDYITRVGGYTVVPAAPALVKIENDPAYRCAATRHREGAGQREGVRMGEGRRQREPAGLVSGRTFSGAASGHRRPGHPICMRLVPSDVRPGPS